MSKMPIWRTKALFIRSIGYFVSVILYHSHSFCWPYMCRKPFYFAMSILIWCDESLPLSDMFSAFWQFLHALAFDEILLHRFSDFNRNSKSVVTHGSSPDRFGNTLMAPFPGIQLQNRSKLHNFSSSFFEELVEVQISIFH